MRSLFLATSLAVLCRCLVVGVRLSDGTDEEGDTVFFCEDNECDVPWVSRSDGCGEIGTIRCLNTNSEQVCCVFADSEPRTLELRNPAVVEPFACTGGAAVGRAVLGWSAEQKTWCCDNKKIGCVSEAYDCSEGMVNSMETAESAWSDAKRSWCCDAKGIGCKANLLQVIGHQETLKQLQQETLKQVQQQQPHEQQLQHQQMHQGQQLQQQLQPQDQFDDADLRIHGAEPSIVSHVTILDDRRKGDHRFGRNYERDDVSSRGVRDDELLDIDSRVRDLVDEELLPQLDRLERDRELAIREDHYLEDDEDGYADRRDHHPVHRPRLLSKHRLAAYSSLLEVSQAPPDPAQDNLVQMKHDLESAQQELDQATQKEAEAAGRVSSATAEFRQSTVTEEQQLAEQIDSTKADIITKTLSFKKEASDAIEKSKAKADAAQAQVHEAQKDMIKAELQQAAEKESSEDAIREAEASKMLREAESQAKEAKTKAQDAMISAKTLELDMTKRRLDDAQHVQGMRDQLAKAEEEQVKKEGDLDKEFELQAMVAKKAAEEAESAKAKVEKIAADKVTADKEAEVKAAVEKEATQKALIDKSLEIKKKMIDDAAETAKEDTIAAQKRQEDLRKKTEKDNKETKEMLDEVGKKHEAAKKAQTEVEEAEKAFKAALHIQTPSAAVVAPPPGGS